MKPQNPYQPPSSDGDTGAAAHAPSDRAQAEQDIQEAAQTALTYAAIGIVCVGVVLGPLAILRANRALRLIEERGVGKQYAPKAQLARLVGAADVLLFVVVVALRLLRDR